MKNSVSEFSYRPTYFIVQDICSFELRQATFHFKFLGEK